MRLGLGKLALALLAAAVTGAAMLGSFEMAVSATAASYSPSFHIMVYALVAAVAAPICLGGLIVAQVLALRLNLLQPRPKPFGLALLGITLGTLMGSPITWFLDEAGRWWVGGFFGLLSALFATAFSLRVQRADA